MALYMRNTRRLIKRAVSLTELHAAPLNSNRLYLVPSAHLIARSTEELLPEYKPFPYLQRRYRPFWMLFDHTRKRMTENSKIVVVEGNIASGKGAFAERLAQEFGMFLLKAPTCDDLFMNKFNNFDVRSLNDQLPPAARLYDVADFYTNPSYKVGFLQKLYLLAKLRYYQFALLHLFSTGQGIVMEQSVWSDQVFAETLYKLGYIDTATLEYYYLIKDNLSLGMWRPHLGIYIDAPVDVCMEKIKKRNLPHEVNSKVLTEDYLQTIEDVYKSSVFDFHRKHGELLIYNHDEVTTDEDWELIIEDLEVLDLEGEEQSIFQKTQHRDWNLPTEQAWDEMRRTLSDPMYMDVMLHGMEKPIDCMHMTYYGDSYEALKDVVMTHPAMSHVPGWNPNMKDDGILFPFFSRDQWRRKAHQLDMRNRTMFDFFERPSFSTYKEDRLDHLIDEEPHDMAFYEEEDHRGKSSGSN